MRAAALLLAICACIGCGATPRGKGAARTGGVPRTDPLGSLPVDPRWKVSPENPILRFGELRTLASWNDPCVLKAKSGYVMYLTTAMEKPGSPPVRPFRAVSEDGRKWQLKPETPLLAPGAAGAFDSASIETPSVVRFQGRYHLYYTGVGAKGIGGPMSIGHAVSEDGIRWTKDTEPVLAPTGTPTDWNGFQVAEPGAVVSRDRIYLYFAAVGLRKSGNPPAHRVIGLAISQDGSRFSAPEEMLQQSAQFSPSMGFDGYSTPAAVVIDGKMQLFYDVGYFDAGAEHNWTQVALHQATSTDGRTGWRQAVFPILKRGHARWTTMEVRSPAPLLDGNRLRLWFAGNADPAVFIDEVRKTQRTALFGIGLAELRFERDPLE